MPASLGVFGVVLIALGVVVVFGVLLLLAYKKVSQGKALVINKMGKVNVKFTG